MMTTDEMLKYKLLRVKVHVHYRNLRESKLNIIQRQIENTWYICESMYYATIVRDM